MSENSFSAKAIRAGYESSEHFNSVVPPIYQTASFDLHDIDRTRRLWTGAEAGGIYSRVGTPTGSILETRIAELDGGKAAVALSSGMAAITLSDDAWAAVDKVETNTFYLDLKAARKSGSKVPPETPYTPSVSLTYAMNEALKMVLEEGLDERVARHHKAAKASVAAVKALGLELFADEAVSSATVTAVKMPEGVKDADFRGTTRDKYGVELAGGQDHLKGNVFRIGHMGNVSYKELTQTFAAIGMTLKGLGAIDDAGAGVASITESYL